MECGVALYAAASAHSAAMLAFGSGSLVEMLSAGVVLLQFTKTVSLTGRMAARTASALLFALAAVVTVTAILALVFGIRPAASPAGLGITAAALVVMPVLAAWKRREARRHTNAALAADAVQSLTCAWLALTVLAGLAVNGALHAGWADPAAALIAVPLLLKEGREAWRGDACGCCR